jgi:hemoglobin-like flavoprotein
VADVSKLFDDSYWRTVSASRDGRAFIDGFYDRFLSTSDEISTKFANTDFDKQKQVLLLSLAFMSTYAASGEPNTVIEKIAASHAPSGHDIRPELYDAWLGCLLDTVREFDPHWSPEVETAWRSTMEPGIAFMKARYQA